MTCGRGGIGAVTLAWIVEEISRRSLDAVEGRAWRPFGMLDTRYRPVAGLEARPT